jgi:hypothetical protein
VGVVVGFIRLLLISSLMFINRCCLTFLMSLQLQERIKYLLGVECLVLLYVHYIRSRLQEHIIRSVLGLRALRLGGFLSGLFHAVGTKDKEVLYSKFHRNRGTYSFEPVRVIQ